MSDKQTGWPFQEGYASDSGDAELIFTDYRWNDGSVTRQWHVDPKRVDLKSVSLRPFSVKDAQTPD